MTHTETPCPRSEQRAVGWVGGSFPEPGLAVLGLLCEAELERGCHLAQPWKKVPGQLAVGQLLSAFLELLGHESQPCHPQGPEPFPDSSAQAAARASQLSWLYAGTRGRTWAFHACPWWVRRLPGLPSESFFPGREREWGGE